MEAGNKNRNTLVSVVIPSYNHQDYIKESVLSTVNQTYPAIELIVIDDGSKDHSPEILRDLQEQYGFTLICQENQGLSKTLNKAIREYTHGKYIAVLASDDYWMKEKIEKQVDFLEENDEFALVFGKAYPVSKSGEILENTFVVDTVTDLTFEALIEKNPIPATTVMFRKEVWKECGGFNEDSYIEDWELWLKIVFRYKIAYLDEYFTYYRIHGKNMSSNVLKLYTCMREIVYRWKDKMDEPMARKVLARRDSITFNVLARKHKKESLRYIDLSYSYLDRFILLNYIKGVYKLLFIW